MKSNLLKILVTLCLVSGIAACNNGKKPDSSSEEGPVTLTLAAAWERETEMDAEGNFPYANVGKSVIIKDLAVAGQFGNTFILNQNWQAPSKFSDFSGIEVEIKEGTTSNAYVYDRCTVSGVLTEVEDRLVVKDGALEITTPAWEVKDDGTRGERLKDETGKNIGSIYYYPVEDRATFDNFSAPYNSGALVDLSVQFASVPERVTVEKGTSFMAVFAGENMDLENQLNESPFEVRIPAGLTEKTVARLNAYLFPEEGDPIAVGDFAVVTGNLQYHGFSQGLVMANYFCDFVDFDTEPEIYETFGDMYAEYGANDVLFHEGMFDFGTALDETGAFSFVPDLSSVGSTGADAYGQYEANYPQIFDKSNQQCEVFVDNWKTAAYFEYTINTSDLQATYNAVCDVLDASEFEAAIRFTYESGDNFMDIWLVYDGEDFRTSSVTRQINVNVYADNGTQIAIEEFGRAPGYEGSVVAALSTMYSDNNATFYAKSSSFEQTVWWTARSLGYAYTSGEESGSGFYTAIAGKFEEDGFYEVGVDQESGDYTFTLADAADLSKTSIADYDYGAPKYLAQYLMMAGVQVAADDALFAITGEELEAGLTTFFTGKVAEDQVAAYVSAYLGYILSDYASAVSFSKSLCQGVKSIEMRLVSDNIFRLTVNFLLTDKVAEEYGITEYATSVLVYDIGTTEFDFEAAVDALPAYEAPAGLRLAVIL